MQAGIDRFEKAAQEEMKLKKKVELVQKKLKQEKQNEVN